MMELTTYTELEIAHRLLTSYAQKCRHLHGHRYEVEITVASPSGLNKDGMIVDFKKLKEVVKEVLDDKWDHGACFNKADRISEFMLKDAERERLHIIDANPTLEWMVAHWVEELDAAFKMAQLDLVVTKLKASETAKNTVTWTREPKTAVAPIDIESFRRAVESMGIGLPEAPICGVSGKTAMEKKVLVDDNPDAVPYLVTYRDCLGMYSEVVYSSWTGKELVEYCKAAVTKVGEPCGPVVVLGISRLPG